MHVFDMKRGKSILKVERIKTERSLEGREDKTYWKC